MDLIPAASEGWPLVRQGLALVTCGGEPVLVEVTSGLVHQLDPVAQLVLEMRHAFTSSEDAAVLLAGEFDEDEATILRKLNDFEQELTTLLTSSVDPRAISNLEPASPPAGLVADKTWQKEALSTSLKIVSYTPEFSHAFAPLVESLIDIEGDGDHLIEVWAIDDGYFATSDGGRLTRNADLSLVVSRVIADLTTLAIVAGDSLALLHAAAVCYNDVGIVLCGGTNQGKSSTTIELMTRGCHYLSDELVEVNANEQTIRGLARPIGLEGPIKERYVELRPAGWVNGSYPRWSIPPTQLGPVAGRVAVDGTFFLRFDADTPPSLRVMGPVEALSEILSHCYNRAHLPAIEIGRLAEFATITPCLELIHNGSLTAADLVDSWVGEMKFDST